jgi:hypothetical protein
MTTTDAMDPITPTRHWPEVQKGAEVRDNLNIRSPATLALALENDLRATFPINQVPGHLLEALREVHQDTKRLTHSLHEFARKMAAECRQVDREPPVLHMGFGPRDVIRGSMCGADGAIIKDMEKVTCGDCVRVMQETSGRG